MKMKSEVLAVLIVSLFLVAAAAWAGGQQGNMESQPGDEQGAMMQDPEKIKQVEQALSSKGYDPGPVDGQWGPESDEALKKFQQAQGMQPTGQLDQQTLASLGVEEGAAAGGQEGDMTGEPPATEEPGAMPPPESGAGAGGQQGSGSY